MNTSEPHKPSRMTCGAHFVVVIRRNVLSIPELKTLTIYIINANILIKYFGSDI